MQLEFHLDARAVPRTERPGGRTARTGAAVLEAARTEFAESGYAGTTVERIALRAGVAKTTVYRRWGGLEGIVVDLLDALGTVEVPAPDTGDVGTDLRELAREIFVLYKDPVLCAMIEVMATAAVHTASARESLTAFFANRARSTATVVERAVERGQFPAGTDPAEVIRLLTAPFYYRLFLTGEPIDRSVADRAAATAVAAARAEVLVTGAAAAVV
ncbi:TetR/AcrR family transcriptional regulator [Streptacidiphilus sp. P02-A3a]|nr:TetR/AcrR family transcriptional regulator [Streptacidiphilus sp. P02-A3a]